MSAQPQTPRSPGLSFSAKELILIAVFWWSLATLSTVNRLIDPRGFGFRFGSPAAPIALGYLEATLWAAATPVIFWLSSRYTPEKGKWFGRLLFLLGVGVVIAVTLHLVMEFARAEFLPVPPRRRGHAPVFSPLREIGRFRFLNPLLLYLAILAAGYAREYFRRDRTRERDTAELLTRTSQLQAQLSVARLDALRMQLNPHFLFNTLNAVSALVERDPSGVRKMIARLSELLRYTIDQPRANEVTLRDELALLQRYIDIMMVRFQGRLQTSLDYSGVEDALVPNLILQPLFENALEHGAAQASGVGDVRLSAERRGDDLIVTIADNGPGPAAVEPGEGVGLTNTAARLEAMYGASASVELKRGENGGAVAQLRIPYHTASDLRLVERGE